MDALLQSLSEDSLSRLALRSTLVPASAARQISLMVKSCKNLHEMEISMQHISLDALRTLFQGVVRCASLKQVFIVGGFSVIQAKVLSSCLKGFTISGAHASSSNSDIQAALAVVMKQRDGTSPSDAFLTTNNSDHEHNFYERFGPSGLSIVLEPTAFNEVTAAILYEGVESSTRIVQLEVRSSMANSHILTVLPRFRRRVQGILKRNARLVLGAQQQFEETMSLVIFHALQQHPQNQHHHHQDHDVVPTKPTSSPTCRVLEFSTKHKATNNYPNTSTGDAPAKSTFTPTSPEFDECSSTTPSPHMMAPPEPVQFRMDTSPDHLPEKKLPLSQRRQKNPDDDHHPTTSRTTLPDEFNAPHPIYAHPHHQRPSNMTIVPCLPPSVPSPLLQAHRPLPPPAAPGNVDDEANSRPFQRHVIIEMANLRELIMQQTNIMAQQAKDVEDVRALALRIRDGNDLVLRELAYLMEHQQSPHVGQHPQHHYLQPQPPPAQAPSGPPRFVSKVPCGKPIVAAHQPRPAIIPRPLPPSGRFLPQRPAVKHNGRVVASQLLGGLRVPITRPPNLVFARGG